MGEALVVSEIFGPTVQGEGPSLGRRCGFVRLGRCNLSCGWCDTAYTWDWQHYDPEDELEHISVDDTLQRLEAMNIRLVVISGGEPLLQQRALEPLLAAIKQRGWSVEVETAGTIAWKLAPELVDRFNVSPKLENSGNMRDRRYKPDVLRQFEATGRAGFKFVVCDVDDLDEVDTIARECGLTDVWVMPEGTDPAVVASSMGDIADAVVARGWNLTTRLHVLAWGDQRGR